MLKLTDSWTKESIFINPAFIVALENEPGEKTGTRVRIVSFGTQAICYHVSETMDDINKLTI